MLAINESRWNQFGTEMADVLSSTPSIEEGACVVRKMENGVAKTDYSAGVATEPFAGIAVSGGRNVSQISGFEEVSVPATAPYVVTLGHTPIGAVTATFIPSAGGLTVGAGAPSGTGTVQQAGKVLTFAGADAGKKVRVFFKRNLSLVESQALYGEVIAQGGLLGKTGLITKGEYVYTSHWDPASDWWSKIGPVYTGAGGNFSLTTTGAVCESVTVFAAPTADFPFLGLNLK